MIFEEIEKVHIGKEADFTSEMKGNSEYYSFCCKNCDGILKIIKIKLAFVGVDIQII